MKVSVKLNNETAFQVTVPNNSTVEDLKIASLVALPADSGITKAAKLWYSGRKMDFSSTLKSYGITEGSKSCVYLTSGEVPAVKNGADAECAIADDEAATEAASEGTESKAATEGADGATIPQPPAKKARSKSKSKSRCSLKGCHAPALRLTGECQFCQGKFCSKHRLLEKHNCKGLKSCKDKSYERNALKLRSEQTVASKV